MIISLTKVLKSSTSWWYYCNKGRTLLQRNKRYSPGCVPWYKAHARSKRLYEREACVEAWRRGQPLCTIAQSPWLAAAQQSLAAALAAAK